MIRDAIGCDEACMCLFYRSVTCVHVQQRLCSDANVHQPGRLIGCRWADAVAPWILSWLQPCCQTARHPKPHRPLLFRRQLLGQTCCELQRPLQRVNGGDSILGMLNLSAGQMCVLCVFVSRPVLICCLTVTPTWIFISAGSVHKDVGNKCFSLAH